MLAGANPGFTFFPGGAYPGIHVLASGRVRLSAWRLWHGSEGAQSADPVALRRPLRLSRLEAVAGPTVRRSPPTLAEGSRSWRRCLPERVPAGSNDRSLAA